ncbi:hypothetical protein DPMN_012749 [Dreissena polymorpha]|uniref:Uncharacterized protein n=1 Tax=Dreissena polymorpha TaxID=45954 RepID=A0A9D4N7L6_DREPO|nr:hypothetical protein DPMN_128666 [Dreissena polymorpha]KAH3888709.1 hypothetical protein DPMN_012749 [Dreissena polymorpha]
MNEVPSNPPAISGVDETLFELSFRRRSPSVTFSATVSNVTLTPSSVVTLLAAFSRCCH